MGELKVSSFLGYSYKYIFFIKKLKYCFFVLFSSLDRFILNPIRRSLLSLLSHACNRFLLSALRDGFTVALTY